MAEHPERPDWVNSSAVETIHRSHPLSAFVFINELSISWAGPAESNCEKWTFTVKQFHISRVQSGVVAAFIPKIREQFVRESHFYLELEFSFGRQFISCDISDIFLNLIRSEIEKKTSVLSELLCASTPGFNLRTFGLWVHRGKISVWKHFT